jgi:hypothetical protein
VHAAARRCQPHRPLKQKSPLAPCIVVGERTPFPKWDREATNCLRLNPNPQAMPGAPRGEASSACGSLKFGVARAAGCVRLSAAHRGHRAGPPGPSGRPSTARAGPSGGATVGPLCAVVGLSTRQAACSRPKHLSLCLSTPGCAAEVQAPPAKHSRLPPPGAGAYKS